MNLAAWRRAPIWKGEQGRTGNLSKSLAGTLADPVISEDGRRFLEALLTQLTDRQLEDLYVARVTRREDPSTQATGSRRRFKTGSSRSRTSGANHPASVRVTAYGLRGSTSSHVH